MASSSFSEGYLRVEDIESIGWCKSVDFFRRLRLPFRREGKMARTNITNGKKQKTKIEMNLILEMKNPVRSANPLNVAVRKDGWNISYLHFRNANEISVPSSEPVITRCDGVLF